MKEIDCQDCKYYEVIDEVYDIGQCNHYMMVYSGGHCHDCDHYKDKKK